VRHEAVQEMRVGPSGSAYLAVARKKWSYKRNLGQFAEKVTRKNQADCSNGI